LQAAVTKIFGKNHSATRQQNNNFIYKPHVLWVCVRIEDDERCKKRGDEKAKSQLGNETAGGICTKFTRDWPRDTRIFRERHALQRKEKELIWIIFTAVELRIIKFFSFSLPWQQLDRHIYIWITTLIKLRKLLSDMQGRQLIIFHRLYFTELSLL